MNDVPCFATELETGRILSVSRCEDRFDFVVATPGTVANPSLFVSPGLVDIQVNGFAGVDFNSPSVGLEEIDRALQAILRTGVTRCFPTVITGPAEAMVASLANLRGAQRELGSGKLIAGFHVEGPHLSAEDGPRGAHPIESVRAPDFREFERWQEATEGEVRLITVSPHWPEAMSYIERVVRAGVTVSIGHTHATPEQIEDAVHAGATMSTHLGNATHRELAKFRNYLWSQLAHDGLTASFIADGIHLPAEFLRPALRAKTLDRSVLITDASSPAGAIPGRYRLGHQEVDLLEDGRVVLAGQDRLAGSSLKLNDAIAHVMQVGGWSLREAVQMATLNPERVIGLPPTNDRVLLRVTEGQVEPLAVSINR